jgi:hypothetical protein
VLPNDTAERVEVRKRRPLNDLREVTLNDRWSNVARSLSYQPEKDTAVALFERVATIRRGSVRQFQRVVPGVHRAHRMVDGREEVAGRRMLDRGLERVRTALHQAMEKVRQAQNHIMAQMADKNVRIQRHRRRIS